MVEATAPKSVLSSGTLKSAFKYFRLYRTSKAAGSGFNAIGIGDPAILTKPQGVSGAGYIGEFIAWLRGVNQKKYESFQKKWGKVKAQRAKIQTRYAKAKKSEQLARAEAKRKRSAAYQKRLETGRLKKAERTMREYVGAIVYEHYIKNIEGTLHPRAVSLVKMFREFKVPEYRQRNIISQALKHYRSTPVGREAAEFFKSGGGWSMVRYYVNYRIDQARKRR